MLPLGIAICCSWQDIRQTSCSNSHTRLTTRSSRHTDILCAQNIINSNWSKQQRTLKLPILICMHVKV